VDAIAQCFQQRFSPTKWDEWRSLLIDLLVGLREELHIQRVPLHEFIHPDRELDISPRLFLFDRKELQLGKLFRRVFLRKYPFSHGIDPFG
jgi:hypothetical protein